MAGTDCSRLDDWVTRAFVLIFVFPLSLLHGCGDGVDRKVVCHHCCDDERWDDTHECLLNPDVPPLMAEEESQACHDWCDANCTVSLRKLNASLLACVVPARQAGSAITRGALAVADAETVPRTPLPHVGLEQTGVTQKDEPVAVRFKSIGGGVGGDAVLFWRNPVTEVDIELAVMPHGEDHAENSFVGHTFVVKCRKNIVDEERWPGKKFVVDGPLFTRVLQRADRPQVELIVNCDASEDGKKDL